MVSAFYLTPFKSITKILVRISLDFEDYIEFPRNLSNFNLFIVILIIIIFPRHECTYMYMYEHTYID